MDAVLHGPAAGPGQGLARLRTAPRRTDMSWPIWWLTLGSLTCLTVGPGFGRAAVLLFLLCWVVYGLAWPARSLDQLLRVRLPWLFPLLALASTLWSQSPADSLRGAIQLMILTASGLLLAQAQPARSFIAALMCVMLAAVLFGVAIGGSAGIGMTGETALIGIYGSKNQLALLVSMMMISAAAVLPDRRQPGLLRWIAAFCFLLGPIMLVLTKSAGAVATLGLALSCFGAFWLLGRLPARVRPLFLLSLGLLVLGALGVFYLLDSSGVWDELLRAAGKDSTLTGRLFIWQRAEQLIGLNPLLGVGYQAFWIQGMVEAEGLWRFGKISNRFGFSFHNLYYEAAVTLGLLGAAILGGTLAMLAGRALLNACRRPGVEPAFFAALITLLFARAYIETEFINPFAIGSLLIPIFWVYSTQATGTARRPRAH